MWRRIYTLRHIRFIVYILYYFRDKTPGWYLNIEDHDA